MQQLLTEEELAAILRVTRSTLWTLRKYEGMPYCRVGRSVRYEWTSVQQWLKKRTDAGRTGTDLGFSG